MHSQLKETAAAVLPIANSRSQISNTPESIHRAILTGLLSNVGVKGDDFEYDGIRGKRFFIFPGSTQFAKKPPWIVAAEVVQTTRQYGRNIAPVLPEWIEQAAGHMVQREYTDPVWQSRTGLVTAQEKVSLHGLTLIPRRVVDYGEVDPRTSRELFIQGALVVQDFVCDAPFFRENARLRLHIESLEARQRRKDLLADYKTIFAFYNRIIPASVVSAQTFNQWRHQAEQSDRRVLFMKESDLLAGDAGKITEQQFPARVTLEGVEGAEGGKLDLEYRFDIGHAADGVTLRVPITMLHLVDQATLDWLVPGMLREKITALVRTLPKEIRTGLVPHAEAADAALSRMTFGEGEFYAVVAFELGHQIGRQIDPRLFKRDEIEAYLHMNIAVLDNAGKVIAAGRDLAALRTQLHIQARSSLQHRSSQWHKDGIKTWDFGDLPESVQFRSGPLTIQCYPALTDNGVTASLRLMENALAASVESRKGIRRLAMITMADQLQWQFKILTNIERLIPLYKPLGNREQLRETFCVALADRLLFAGNQPIRSKVEFDERLDAAWNNLRQTAEQLSKVAEEIVTLRNDLSSRLAKDFSPLLLPAVSEMRDQLVRLCPSNVLSIHPWEWLMHMPRFLHGIRIRLQKLSNAGLIKDAHNAAMVAPLWRAWLDRKKAAESSGVSTPDLLQLRYLIEELRVSLFAQELKTSVPVSVAKLQKHFAAA